MGAHNRRAGRGRISRRRAGLAGAVVTLASGAMLALIADGALATSFTVSSQQFKISADTMDATGFVNYGWVNQKADRTAEPVAIAGMRRAELTNLCQSVLTTLPIVGDITLRLTAGADSPVIGTNMTVDMNQMDGDAVFDSIEIGRDASTLNKGPAGAVGLQGLFGQQANTLHVDHLQQIAWATQAGTFTLPGLQMKISRGRNECF
ncbi:DUF6230 family protein [Catenuloplanes japonicus]|uniref:DUF6230 family protein n=1 Tax=Catenuloplanes japonicus TaxID=33876 RepID=UPI00052580C6|nr:DUF6230 family protein [Catenuloplanes japonicus]